MSLIQNNTAARLAQHTPIRSLLFHAGAMYVDIARVAVG